MIRIYLIKKLRINYYIDMNRAFVLLILLCSLYRVTFVASLVQKRKENKIESKQQSNDIQFKYITL